VPNEPEVRMMRLIGRTNVSRGSCIADKAGPHADGGAEATSAVLGLMLDDRSVTVSPGPISSR